MKINIKKTHKDAVIPKYASKGDAGLDLTAVSKKITDNYVEYDTGLSFEIPEGYVGLLFPRSSISKTDLTLSNSVGVIDSGYRGSISFRFRYKHPLKSHYRIGDRVGQIIIMPYPPIDLEEVDNLSDTERGDGGFGSTGK